MDDYGFPGPIAPAGGSAYYVIRLASPHQQPALIALFGWRRELIRIANAMSDAGLARIKLQWWREELQRAAAGTAQHPLARRLDEAMHRHGLPVATLDTMAEAVDQDLRGDAPWSRDDLLAHCARGGGSFGELLALVAGAPPETGQELGTAARLAEILRDLGGDLRRERCRVPRADLDAAGLTPDLDALRDSTSAEPLRRLLADLAALARSDRRRAGPASRWYALRRALLDEIARGGFDVLDAKISIVPLRKLWVAWRA
jgi:phytoene synthase